MITLHHDDATLFVGLGHWGLVPWPRPEGA